MEYVVFYADGHCKTESSLSLQQTLNHFKGKMRQDLYSLDDKEYKIYYFSTKKDGNLQQNKYFDDYFGDVVIFQYRGLEEKEWRELHALSEAEILFALKSKNDK